MECVSADVPCMNVKALVLGGLRSAMAGPKMGAMLMALDRKAATCVCWGRDEGGGRGQAQGHGEGEGARGKVEFRRSRCPSVSA